MKRSIISIAILSLILASGSLQATETQTTGCPSNCGLCTKETTPVCLGCNNGFFLNNNKVCEACSADCLKCSSNTVCEECGGGNYLWNGGCVSTCPTGTGKKKDFTCQFCKPNCLSCSKDAESCESCKQDYFIAFGGGCEVCPTTCTKCLDFGKCEKCISEYKLVDGVCKEDDSWTFWNWFWAILLGLLILGLLGFLVFWLLGKRKQKTGYSQFDNSGGKELGLSFYDENGVRDDRRVYGGVGLNESYTVAPSSKQQIGPLKVPRDGSIRNSGVTLIPTGNPGLLRVGQPIPVGSRAISAPRVIQRRVVMGSPGQQTLGI